eukprot:8875156-Alexandrium_andersonii.AAC.1
MAAQIASDLKEGADTKDPRAGARLPAGVEGARAASGRPLWKGGRARESSLRQAQQLASLEGKKGSGGTQWAMGRQDVGKRGGTGAV